MVDPHVPRVDGDWLYGRGAYDMKAGLAAALIAARDVARLGLPGDVVVAAVADEEHASTGVQDVLRSIRVDAAIVTEPTELEVVIAHKGFVWIEVEVTGRAAHGSRPALGVDAIVKTGPVLVELGVLDASLAHRLHPLLGRASVHASLIEGGRELSSYPARCVVKIERRTLPGESTADVERELAELLDRCRASDSAFIAEPRTLLVRGPLEIDPRAEIVETVRSAAASVSGAEPPLAGASYWADSGFIAAAGIPTVLYGPSGEGAHAIEERVSLRDTELVARTLVDVAARFCR
jgi:acetylornithine deacetylase